MEVYTKVNVLYVKSPSAIYVEKVTANKAYLYNLLQDLSKECDKDMSCNLTSTPSKDMPCAARGNDGYWYRGLVEEATENGASVFFVDLGYTLNLEYYDLKSLHPKYLSCAAQAIKVMLRYIKPKTDNSKEWGEEVTEYLRYILTQAKSCRVIPFEMYGDKYSVCMYINKETNVGNLLVKNNLALPNKTSARNTKSKKNKKNDESFICDVEKHTELNNDIDQSFSEESVKSSIKNKKSVDNEDPFKINVEIHQVQSPDCIYVSDVMSDRTDVDKLMKSMQEFYTMFYSTDNVWHKDSVCTVYSEKSQMYYRARIVDIKSNDKVIVFLYDVGIEETVSIDNIQPLYPAFANTPAHIFKIKLTGILPCGGSDTWPTFSCQKLCEIIDSNHKCKFYISKVDEEDMEDGAIPVELWIKQMVIDGPLSPARYEINSINRLLVESGAALPIKTYSSKRDKILAIELKRRLSKKIELLSKSESNVHWFEINSHVEALSSLEAFIAKTTLDTSSCADSQGSNDDKDLNDICDNLPSFPKLSAWLPAEPIKDDVFIAIPTYIDDDGFIYLHSVTQNSYTLKYIEETLGRMYNQPPIESCDSLWKVGDMCIAQYHPNKKWYRGKIVGIVEDNIFNVEFVDYGNVEQCLIGTLKKKVILGSIPIQCTKCTVYGLIPENGKWLTKDLDRIHSIIIERQCEVTVIERADTHLVISLSIKPNELLKKKTELITYLIYNLKMNIKPAGCTMDKQPALVEDSPEADDTVTEFMENRSTSSDEKSIAEPIICENLETNSFTDNTNESSSSNDTIENLPLLVTSTPCAGSEETLSDKYMPLHIPEDVAFVEIEICCGITVTEFFAQLRENVHSTILNSYYTHYKSVMTEIQEEASKQPVITTFAPNTPCCAKFNDDLWYRCVIRESKLDEDSDDIVINLFYVDYGNDEYKKLNPQKCELYSLKKEWLNVPPMSMKCKLWNLQVASTIEQNDLELTTEIEKCYNIPIVAVIKEFNDNTRSVELYKDDKCEEHLFEKLIEKGLLVHKE